MCQQQHRQEVRRTTEIRTSQNVPEQILTQQGVMMTPVVEQNDFLEEEDDEVLDPENRVIDESPEVLFQRIQDHVRYYLQAAGALQDHEDTLEQQIQEDEELARVLEESRRDLEASPVQETREQQSDAAPAQQIQEQQSDAVPAQEIQEQESEAAQAQEIQEEESEAAQAQEIQEEEEEVDEELARALEESRRDFEAAQAEQTREQQSGTAQTQQTQEQRSDAATEQQIREDEELARALQESQRDFDIAQAQRDREAEEDSQFQADIARAIMESQLDHDAVQLQQTRDARSLALTQAAALQEPEVTAESVQAEQTRQENVEVRAAIEQTIPAAQAAAPVQTTRPGRWAVWKQKKAEDKIMKQKVKEATRRSGNKNIDAISVSMVEVCARGREKLYNSRTRFLRDKGIDPSSNAGKDTLLLCPFLKGYEQRGETGGEPKTEEDRVRFEQDSAFMNRYVNSEDSKDREHVLNMVTKAIMSIEMPPEGLTDDYVYGHVEGMQNLLEQIRCFEAIRGSLTDRSNPNASFFKNLSEDDKWMIEKKLALGKQMGEVVKAKLAKKGLSLSVLENGSEPVEETSVNPASLLNTRVFYYAKGKEHANDLKNGADAKEAAALEQIRLLQLVDKGVADIKDQKERQNLFFRCLSVQYELPVEKYSRAVWAEPFFRAPEIIQCIPFGRLQRTAAERGLEDQLHDTELLMDYISDDPKYQQWAFETMLKEFRHEDISVEDLSDEYILSHALQLDTAIQQAASLKKELDDPLSPFKPTIDNLTYSERARLDARIDALMQTEMIMSDVQAKYGFRHNQAGDMLQKKERACISLNRQGITPVTEFSGPWLEFEKRFNEYKDADFVGMGQVPEFPEATEEARKALSKYPEQMRQLDEQSRMEFELERIYQKNKDEIRDKFSSRTQSDAGDLVTVTKLPQFRQSEIWDELKGNIFDGIQEEMKEFITSVGLNNLAIAICAEHAFRTPAALSYFNRMTGLIGRASGFNTASESYDNDTAFSVRYVMTEILTDAIRNVYKEVMPERMQNCEEKFIPRIRQSLDLFYDIEDEKRDVDFVALRKLAQDIAGQMKPVTAEESAPEKTEEQKASDVRLETGNQNIDELSCSLAEICENEPYLQENSRSRFIREAGIDPSSEEARYTLLLRPFLNGYSQQKKTGTKEFGSEPQSELDSIHYEQDSDLLGLFCSKNKKDREKALSRITQSIKNIELPECGLTDEYVYSHIYAMQNLIEQIRCFENLREDDKTNPNADYFKNLPADDRTELEINLELGKQIGEVVKAKMAKKGLCLSTLEYGSRPMEETAENGAVFAPPRVFYYASGKEHADELKNGAEAKEEEALEKIGRLQAAQKMFRDKVQQREKPDRSLAYYCSYKEKPAGTFSSAVWAEPFLRGFKARVFTDFGIRKVTDVPTDDDFLNQMKDAAFLDNYFSDDPEKQMIAFNEMLITFTRANIPDSEKLTDEYVISHSDELSTAIKQAASIRRLLEPMNGPYDDLTYSRRREIETRIEALGQVENIVRNVEARHGFMHIDEYDMMNIKEKNCLEMENKGNSPGALDSAKRDDFEERIKVYTDASYLGIDRVKEDKEQEQKARETLAKVPAEIKETRRQNRIEFRMNRIYKEKRDEIEEKYCSDTQTAEGALLTVDNLNSFRNSEIWNELKGEAFDSFESRISELIKGYTDQNQLISDIVQCAAEEFQSPAVLNYFNRITGMIQGQKIFDSNTRNAVRFVLTEVIADALKHVLDGYTPESAGQFEDYSMRLIREAFVDPSAWVGDDATRSFLEPLSETLSESCEYIASQMQNITEETIIGELTQGKDRHLDEKVLNLRQETQNQVIDDLSVAMAEVCGNVLNLQENSRYRFMRESGIVPAREEADQIKLLRPFLNGYSQQPRRDEAEGQAKEEKQIEEEKQVTAEGQVEKEEEEAVEINMDDLYEIFRRVMPDEEDISKVGLEPQDEAQKSLYEQDASLMRLYLSKDKSEHERALSMITWSILGIIESDHYLKDENIYSHVGDMQNFVERIRCFRAIAGDENDPDNPNAEYFKNMSEIEKYLLFFCLNRGDEMCNIIKTKMAKKGLCLSAVEADSEPVEVTDNDQVNSTIPRVFYYVKGKKHAEELKNRAEEADKKIIPNYTRIRRNY